MKEDISETQHLEDLIINFKTETDNKKKHVCYLNLVEESLKLVKKIVGSLYPVSVNVPKDDLIQVGALGVLKAVENYETKSKGSFKNYCTIYIKGKILQYLRDKANIVKPPRQTVENINKVREYIESQNITDNNPTAKEIAKATNLPLQTVEDVLNIELLNNIVSLDQRVFSTDGIETLADRIQSQDDKNYQENYDNKKIIEYALEKLPEKERKIICAYYINGLTKKAISEEFGISAMQVARIIKRGLNKMYVILEHDINNEEE